jgi:mannose-6-phosphate isomerase-like protein (cupin superfamily)
VSDGIFRADEHDLEWSSYEGADAAAAGMAAIRYKALMYGRDVPSVTYIEYAPGCTDPVHQHDTGEVFVVVEGEIWLDDARNGPGSVVYIAPDTDYAVRAGDQGARYFRIVTS